jgi:hypothetical protein
MSGRRWSSPTTRPVAIITPTTSWPTRVTTRAFYAAGYAEQYPEIGPAPYQPQRLYYTAIPERWPKVYATIMRLRGQDPTRIGRNEDIDMTQIGHPLSQLTARLNIFPYWEIKRDASAEHRSQGGGGFGSAFPTWLQKRLFHMEYFIRAHPPTVNGEIDRDLFRGCRRGVAGSSQRSSPAPGRPCSLLRTGTRLPAVKLGLP